MQLDALGDASTVKITAGTLDVFGIAVGVDYPTAITHGLGPPDRRVADGRAEFKYGACVDHQGQLLEHTRNGRANNWNVVFGRVLLHLVENFVASRKHRVEIVIDWPGCCEVVMPPTGGRTFLLAWCHDLYLSDGLKCELAADCLSRLHFNDLDSRD